ncbi:ABC transporter permease [Aureimonas jatrophae]|uniref:Phospholipid/cholesterol/gamma-HCH transport system permease protein n=1 Tax=Aureimonas jatrophae TaxID=1166073 RepID=A0A1H0GHS8_9HYPH|nr:MlaE family lipid ABC transporter permease subunit [Aureimonas jatrophae]MBB3949579.1 phospholipid/cholesterol/gamma-HCH transport system permease protein [Aureimonas jatrophae]SDO06466.1 phospholipid/cholesterol/gamma-HCH transport system permease protein [Aureimonas jatrophae]
MLDVPQSEQRQPGREAAAPTIDADKDGGGLTLRLGGDWLARTVGGIESKVEETGKADLGKTVTIDCSGVGRFDTSGAYLVERLARRLGGNGGNVDFQGIADTDQTLFDAVRKALDVKRPEPKKAAKTPLTDFFAAIGANVFAVGRESLSGLNIVGAALYGAGRRLTGQTRWRPAAIVNQMDRMGVRAVPIIALMSFLIGAVIAQQGAFQLRNFGAEIFVVDLVGILQLREIGVLLTAIMIAGRSGSAITAEIGSMKMREEVDALHVIGLNPIGVLVFPRLVALIIVLPLLAFIADIAGLLGAIAITWIYSGIPPEAFITRMRAAVTVGTVFAGLLKAPFMAILIGVVASMEGLKVGGSAESLGQHVTASVVKSIFLVIFLDAVFAIFYAAIGY